jgi:DNA adenine methylase
MEAVSLPPPRHSNVVKPIIPWLGGKRKLADRLLPLFPPHQCYVELFAGGAALFFLRPTPAEMEVLNDVNGDLINLYRVVQNHPQEFARQFEWSLSSRETYDYWKSTRPETLTDIQRAARFFFLRQHAFGGMDAERRAFGYATTSRNGPDWLQIQETLTAAHRRLASAAIEREPWEKCLARYDRDYTFFYADPPYWGAEGYGVDFPFEQYEALSAAMRTCAGKVMVSLNDHPDIRAAFAGHTFHEIGVTYSNSLCASARAVDRRELVITNYTPEVFGGLF